MSSVRRGGLMLAGVGSLLLCWQIVAWWSQSLVVASPASTLRAVIDLLSDGEARYHVLISLIRVLVGLAVGGSVGFLLGIGSGLWESMRLVLEPLRWWTMSVPPITIIALLMLWLGLGSGMVITMTSFMLAPIIYVSTMKGMQLIDARVKDLVGVYALPLVDRIRHVYTPAIAAPLGAGMIQAVCSAVRVVILAEFVGASEGIGSEVAMTGRNLQIADLYAWILMSVLLVAVLEIGILTPLYNRVTRWRSV